MTELVNFLNAKFDELQKKSLTTWEKSIREYVIDWANEWEIKNTEQEDKK